MTLLEKYGVTLKPKSLLGHIVEIIKAPQAATQTNPRGRNWQNVYCDPWWREKEIMRIVKAVESELRNRICFPLWTTNVEEGTK